MYYIVLLLLLLLSFLEIIKAKKHKHLFLLMYGTMALMAIFRFGQLGDYFDYYYLYKNPLQIRDPLFVLYTSVFSLFDLGYQFFLTITELIIFGLAFPFFYKTCKCSFISLLVFYCYTYMVCPMSALRQSVCLSLLLFSYNLLVENKRKLFYILVGIGSFIHISFLSVLLIGLLYDKKYFNGPNIVFVVIFATVLMLFGFDMSSAMKAMFTNRSVYSVTDNPLDNAIQIVLRLIIIIPFLLFKPEYKSDGYYAKAICIIGYVLYCVLASNNLVAGRIEFFFRTFLCLFVSYLSFHYHSSVRRIVLSLFVFVHVVLFFKNLNAAISQGDYNINVTMFNFPYISIFDKSEIDEYTNIEKYDYDES